MLIVLETTRGVLIESDWNLKVMQPTGTAVQEVMRINRIRLEFKVFKDWSDTHAEAVLIESDWNLKLFNPRRVIDT